MSDSVIRVEGLGKKYVLGHQSEGRSRYKSLRDVVADGVGSMFRRSAEARAKDEFWALRDVDFEINQGDRVGIIGRNGAGKSTLLKVLSRIVEPTTGRIGIKGRVASLLEVGTGFHPELTGRENIFLNGAILGMSRREIDRKFDEIVAFAEVERFLDTPVKRYSSGMYVRLAFAVAAHLEPEILIVDEVLAVGDLKFQKKCLGKMEEVGQEGRTILFVSHNMGILQSLCTRGILIANGTVKSDDSVIKTVSDYLAQIDSMSEVNLSDRKDRKGRGGVRLEKILTSSSGYDEAALATGKVAIFKFYLNLLLPNLGCIFTLYDQHGQAVINFNSAVSCEVDVLEPTLNPLIVCKINELVLLPGTYRMNVAITSNGELQDHVEGAVSIEVTQGELNGRLVSSSAYGAVAMKHQWILPTAV
ncbi:MAG: ABC transporter ATP-binding protein [Alkalinema sp. RU_4_3]|nr:ABC transporter ATP-binding protein [Alkalinema sp. RU_4_3]